MLDVSGITLHFGGRLMFEDAAFRVDDGERAALVGPNGAGKSTLLKIIADLQQPEAGTVVIPRNHEVGYLPQHLDLRSECTLLDECRQVFAEVMAHEAEMRELEHRMGEIASHESPEFIRVADRYEHLLHELHRRDAHAMDAHIGRVLGGLGFKVDEFDRPCSTFSGGWQMRIALARLLLQNPDVLLLDEPTNHLDIETIEWLGGWVSQHEGSVLMVSHERAFMDRLCSKIIALEGHGRVIVYRGNYSSSLSARAERREQMRRAWENQQQEITHIQRFIDRFRYQASKASVVQSRVKMLERMERVDPPPPDDLHTINIRFPQPDRSAKEALRAEAINKTYGDKCVLNNLDFTLYRGEKVALVGVNGAGKTTFMRILAGRDTPTSGQVLTGTGVAPAYFAQYENEELALDRTVYQEFLSVAPVGVSGEARSMLAAFLFQGDDVDKPVRVLSGGERTRLRLAKMLCSRFNLLLLDEPTNHLDIASRLTLERALKDYEGTVIFVSHDRYFLDSVPTRVVEIAGGAMRSFPGNYADYLQMAGLATSMPAAHSQSSHPAPKQAAPPQSRAAEASDTPREALPASSSEANRKAEARRAAEQQRLSDFAAELSGTSRKLTKDERRKTHRERQEWQRLMQKAERRAEQAEKQIAALETRKAQLEREMNRPDTASNAVRLIDLTREIEEVRAALVPLYAEWEEAQSGVETVKASEPRE